MAQNKSVGLGGLGNAASKIRKLKSSSAKNDVIDGKQLISVPVSLIVFDDEQVRQKREEYDLDGLADSIREVGLEQPPSVEEMDDGKFKIIIGEMRTRAFLFNHERYPDDPKYNEIPAIKRDVVPLNGMSKRATLRIIQLTENLKRDDGDLFDIADTLQLLQKDLGLDALKKYLADNNHPNNKVAISRWRALSRINDSIRAAVRANNIKDKETIAKLGKIEAKDRNIYQDLITRYQSDELEKSLSKEVTEALRSINDLGIESKTKDKIANTRKTQPAKGKKEEEELLIVADDVYLEDGILVIKTANNNSMKIELPSEMEIAINRSEG